jgi:hypothetical protein
MEIDFVNRHDLGIKMILACQHDDYKSLFDAAGPA